MSVFTPETRETGFWYEMLRLSDSDEKQVELAQRIAGMFALIDSGDEGEVCQTIQ